MSFIFVYANSLIEGNLERLNEKLGKFYFYILM